MNAPMVKVKRGKYHIGTQNNRSNAIKLQKMEKDNALLELELVGVYG